MLLGFFIVFVYYVVGMMRSGPVPGTTVEAVALPTGFRASLLIVVGLSLLFLGGKWVVSGATHMASGLGVSEALIGLTIVAAGTSLPELATSVAAAYKKKSDIAVGNVVGSNIFNIFFILGVSSVIGPVSFVPARNVDIGVCMLASVLLFIFMFSGKRGRLDRWEAFVLLGVFGVYLIFLLWRG